MSHQQNRHRRTLLGWIHVRIDEGLTAVQIYEFLSVTVQSLVFRRQSVVQIWHRSAKLRGWKANFTDEETVTPICLNCGNQEANGIRREIITDYGLRRWL